MTVAREVVLIGEKIWVETIRHSQGIIMTIANHSYKRVNARKIIISNWIPNWIKICWYNLWIASLNSIDLVDCLRCPWLRSSQIALTLRDSNSEKMLVFSMKIMYKQKIIFNKLYWISHHHIAAASRRVPRSPPAPRGRGEISPIRRVIKRSFSNSKVNPV